MATEKNVVIVDTSFESLTLPLWHSWIEEKVDVGTALAQWKDMSVSNHENISTKAREDRVALAMNVGATDVVYSDESIVCTPMERMCSSRIMPSRCQRISRSSCTPLRLEDTEKAACRVRANLLPPTLVCLTTSTVGVACLQSTKRIQSDCSWDGGKSFNTFVLRQPTTRQI